MTSKTWTTFKTFFAAKYHDLAKRQKVNTSKSNLQGANAVLNISTALDNLAMGATTNQDIVANLTQSNKQPTGTNTLLKEQLKISPKNQHPPHQNLGHTKANIPNTPLLDTRQLFNQQAWEANLDPAGYCLSHIYRVQKGHSSAMQQGDGIKGGSMKGET
jgi:hypothetical protein